MRIKIYADCADAAEIRRLHASVDGFTTNPSLMNKVGIKHSVHGYEKWARGILEVTDKPVSFEVTYDDEFGMLAQAQEINRWGPNVYIKIPVTDTRGRSTIPIVGHLRDQGIKVNVTAVFTTKQVQDVAKAGPAIISLFAGRIADTGRNPESAAQMATDVLTGTGIKLLWASTREVWNIFQAERAGCQIITVSPDILAKMSLIGKSLEHYSLETVRQFYDDAH